MAVEMQRWLKSTTEFSSNRSPPCFTKQTNKHHQNNAKSLRVIATDPILPGVSATDNMEEDVSEDASGTYPLALPWVEIASYLA